jgi:type I restriction enzyme S subunit
LAKDFHPRGIPLVRLAGLGGHQVTLNKCDFLDPSLVERRWSHFRLELGDILISTSASFGRPAVVGPAAEGAVFYTGLVRFRSASAELDEGYLKTFLGSRAFMVQAEAEASGSVISHFGPSHLRRMEVPLPPLKDQRAIAEVHAALDDKLELNRRMNETLEAMAQAIFRDWFVDFGPVRRKMAGVIDPIAIMGGLTPDPTRAAELAALFPMDFEVSDFPIGWDAEPVIDQANWVNGAAYKKMHFVAPGEGLPVIKIAELKAGVTSTTGFTNTDLGSRYRIDDGELLFSWSGNPDTSIDTFIWTGGPAWLNQHIFAVRPNGTRTLGFLFAMLKYLNPTFAEIARDKQTTGLGHVTKEDLKRLRVVVPPKTIETAFDMLMTPIFQKLQASLLENRTLAETRDYLLPRLMSGEVRVGDAAQEIAA